MRANEDNFIDLIKRRREEGLVYVIRTYGGLLKSIVQKRLFASPDRVEECMNVSFSESGRILTVLTKAEEAL